MPARSSGGCCSSRSLSALMSACLLVGVHTLADVGSSTRCSTHARTDGRITETDSLLAATTCSSPVLTTQVPNRLAERLRVGNLPPGRLTHVAARIHDVHLVSHANLLEVHTAEP